MPNRYCCPNCKTNKTRFNLIEQIAHPVKKDPQTGDVLQTFDNETPDPFHIKYNGPVMRVQCASCGLIEDEQTFTSYGRIM